MTSVSVDDLAMRSDDECPKDRYGRYLIIPQGGKKPIPHTRVTTFSSTLDDRYGLERWGHRMVAVGLATRSDLYAQVAATRLDDKQALDRLCDEAKEAAAASAKANLGTALHAFCERIDLGETVQIPEPWDADVKAYRAQLDAAGIEILQVEKHVVIPKYELAGRLDRILTFGSQPVIADLKTGATLEYSWGGIAVQLACYANAESIYDARHHKHLPMPDVRKDVALVIHLPAGQARCTLWWVDITAGWEAATHAAWVRGWRKQKTLAEPWRPASQLDATIERRVGIVTRLQTLKANPAAIAAAAARWPTGVPTFKQSEQHTAEQLTAIDNILMAVEDEFEIEFGPVDANHKATLKGASA